MASGSSGQTGKNENAEFIVLASPSLLQQSVHVPLRDSHRRRALAGEAHRARYASVGSFRRNEMRTNTASRQDVHGLDDAFG